MRVLDSQPAAHHEDGDGAVGREREAAAGRAQAVRDLVVVAPVQFLAHELCRELRPSELRGRRRLKLPLPGLRGCGEVLAQRRDGGGGGGAGEEDAAELACMAQPLHNRQQLHTLCTEETQPRRPG